MHFLLTNGSKTTQCCCGGCLLFTGTSRAADAMFFASIAAVYHGNVGDDTWPWLPGAFTEMQGPFGYSTAWRSFFDEVYDVFQLWCVSICLFSYLFDLTQYFLVLEIFFRSSFFRSLSCDHGLNILGMMSGEQQHACECRLRMYVCVNTKRQLLIYIHLFPSIIEWYDVPGIYYDFFCRLRGRYDRRKGPLWPRDFFFPECRWVRLKTSHGVRLSWRRVEVAGLKYSRHAYNMYYQVCM